MTKWPVEHDLSGTLVVLLLGDHGDAQTLRPGLTDQLFHVAFAAEKREQLAELRFERETLEVAKVIEEQSGDLAGTALGVLFPNSGRWSRLPRPRKRTARPSACR